MDLLYLNIYIQDKESGFWEHKEQFRWDMEFVHSGGFLSKTTTVEKESQRDFRVRCHKVAMKYVEQGYRTRLYDGFGGTCRPYWENGVWL